ncbi:MAG: type II toxin-antitoxin system HipA family toxin [Bacteroidales bacterium]|nr:type II toxin-antitoxin system HipA family toxin [Bacteroidales bacterium]
MQDPVMIGILSAHRAKGRKAFSFEYDKGWISSSEQFMLDPDIAWYSGQQYPVEKETFGIFMDSMPDTWGRTLMQRRAALTAKEANKTTPKLYDIDFLLGVFDECRSGALRYKLDLNGPFLDDNSDYPTPPWSSVSKLQNAADQIESGSSSKELNKWLAILIAPGSSLGGARPKANILDKQKQLWIAKFPSRNDSIDKALWEYLAYELAIKSGIEMTPSKIQKVGNRHHTFLTKRFDRKNGERVHFASAMTMTGYNEDLLRNTTPSYLDIAEFIQFHAPDPEKDLAQLWRRIVFNILISNTDDHLRNHGFLLSRKGWSLSPAYDINPEADKAGLSLNIDINDNSLDLDLARSVGEYFLLTQEKMSVVIEEVRSVIKTWPLLAKKLKIPNSEQIMMERAFRV